jgi:hypothetical protein
MITIDIRPGAIVNYGGQPAIITGPDTRPPDKRRGPWFAIPLDREGEWDQPVWVGCEKATLSVRVEDMSPYTLKHPRDCLMMGAAEDLACALMRVQALAIGDPRPQDEVLDDVMCGAEFDIPDRDNSPVIAALLATVTRLLDERDGKGNTDG